LQANKATEVVAKDFVRKLIALSMDKQNLHLLWRIVSSGVMVSEPDVKV